MAQKQLKMLNANAVSKFPKKTAFTHIPDRAVLVRSSILTVEN